MEERTMNKVNISELSLSLVGKYKLPKQDAEKFLSLMFDVANDALKDERQLKVRGLGTFKLLRIKDRESVDVNTGDRIVIEGRDKISYTPDPILRDIVNKPFAKFETVILNDDVDFTDIDKESGVKETEDGQVVPDDSVGQETLSDVDNDGTVELNKAFEPVEPLVPVDNSEIHSEGEVLRNVETNKEEHTEKQQVTFLANELDAEAVSGAEYVDDDYDDELGSFSVIDDSSDIDAHVQEHSENENTDRLDESLENESLDGIASYEERPLNTDILAAEFLMADKKPEDGMASADSEPVSDLQDKAKAGIVEFVEDETTVSDGVTEIKSDLENFNDRSAGPNKNNDLVHCSGKSEISDNDSDIVGDTMQDAGQNDYEGPVESENSSEETGKNTADIMNENIDVQIVSQLVADEVNAESVTEADEKGEIDLGVVPKMADEALESVGVQDNNRADIIAEKAENITEDVDSESDEQVVGLENNTLSDGIETPSEESEDDEGPVYDEDDGTMTVSRKLVYAGIALIVVLLGCLGYYVYNYNRLSGQYDKMLKMISENSDKKVQKSNEALERNRAKEDSLRLMEQQKAITEAEKAKNGEKVSEKDGKESSGSSELSSDAYDKDPRIRMGAYRIIGVKTTIKAKAGQTTESIAKAYLGKGMECYIEALNGKDIKEGQEVKIPELKLKKRK